MPAVISDLGNINARAHQAMRPSRGQVRDEDGARMVALLDRDASDDIDFDEFRKFVCLLPQSQARCMLSL